MALEMRTNCERCEHTLDAHSTAYICTHECTFCEDCTEEMHGVCQNCGGELVKRPRAGGACPISRS
ncbi:DUF1272 domain-containing protein [Bacillus sp. SJS]|uniref:DUF1272 domain-containing protein n=1 Tax=Bacillus sp. SJS TaxID=1423321 RepID=UPI0009ED6F6B|nr:DUF1272 domain-containing protein [Bacillus sp. SJS]